MVQKLSSFTNTSGALVDFQQRHSNQIRVCVCILITRLVSHLNPHTCKYVTRVGANNGKSSGALHLRGSERAKCLGVLNI